MYLSQQILLYIWCDQAIEFLCSEQTQWIHIFIVFWGGPIVLNGSLFTDPFPPSHAVDKRVVAAVPAKGSVYAITMAMHTCICHCHMCTVSYSPGVINQRNIRVIHISGGGGDKCGCWIDYTSWNLFIVHISLLRTQEMLKLTGNVTNVKL